MVHKKPKVFFLTFYPPVPEMGGAMAYYRHFLERDDIELFIATDDRRVLEYNLRCPVLIFNQPRWLERLCKTRLSLWAHSLKNLVAGRFIPSSVLNAALEFQPDIIFTYVGGWGWTATMAQVLAHRTGAKLVGSFNDWFDFGIIIHPVLKPILERKYRNFYQQCHLALCTSDGMREELGVHDNAHVLYPIGSVRIAEHSEYHPYREGRPYQVFFGGNLGEWYGKMVESLILRSIEIMSPVEFSIYGGNQSWSDEFDVMVRDHGIYHGIVSFEQLACAAARADFLLLPMGFGQECALTERTSFKTKFLDYLSYRKPILVWGPEYCSAVRVAREFDSAEVCSDPDPMVALIALQRLAENPDRQKQLVENADRMYRDRFSPDKIHDVLMKELLSII